MSLAEQLRSKKKALTVEELADLLGLPSELGCRDSLKDPKTGRGRRKSARGICSD